MFTIVRIETFHQEIKKSRFIACVGPVENETTAKEFIARHSDLAANHNCWAWRTGQNYRFNDDGEPSGTAGKPILQAIDGLKLDHVAVVVTRWFGGILLGSGGLMRAYGGTASLCLRAAEKTEIIPSIVISISCDFAELALVKSRLSMSSNVHILAENFGPTGAELRVSVPEQTSAYLFTIVMDLTRGRALISTL